ncbi:hypothetical protein QYF61_012497 [Mycteria americana]|uniref:Uncharacterized protein n=1 Tax=Mycteria americana TaxID=33587 RepID=A0AAN7NIZ5_MYCAM|nr:hypothetical protein QYF61_012497 [Mycteria americana]
MEPAGMDYFCDQVQQKDVGRRMQVGQELLEYLSDPARSPDLEQDQQRLDKVIDELTGWVNSSNFKILRSEKKESSEIKKVLHLGWGNPWFQYRLGDDVIESSPAKKDLGVLMGPKAGHEPTTCARSPEGQLYPGLHQKKRGQQVEGGDSAPLLCSDETSPGVLRPALEPQHKKDMELLERVQRGPQK